MSTHVVSWVLEHSEAKLADRLVLIVMADHASKDGADAYPTVGTIARETRLSEASVHRSIRSLVEMGAIVVEGKRPDARADRAPNRYRVVMDAAATGSQIDTPESTSTGSRIDTSPNGTGSHIDTPLAVTGSHPVSHGVSSCIPTGSQIETQTVLIEPSIEPTTARACARDVMFDVEHPRGPTKMELAAAFTEFWGIYPRKTGKKEAERKFEIASRTVATAVIIAGARRYAAYVANRDPAYTRYPATWLNQGCWDDELSPGPAWQNGRRPVNDAIPEAWR